MKLNQLIFLIILLLIISASKGQNKHQLAAFYIGLELAHKPADNIRSSGGGRSLLFGGRISIQKLGIIGKVGVGFKGSKHNLFPTSYQKGFLQKIIDNYVPVQEDGLEKIIAEAMYNLASGDSRYNTSASYNQSFHIGLIFDKLPLKPSVFFNFGNDSPILRGPSLKDESEYFDYSFASGSTPFKELAIGSSIPLVRSDQPNFFITPTIVCRWTDYNTISYSEVPLSIYTSGDIANSYQHSNRLYFSISLVYWVKKEVFAYMSK